MAWKDVLPSSSTTSHHRRRIRPRVPRLAGGRGGDPARRRADGDRARLVRASPCEPVWDRARVYDIYIAVTSECARSHAPARGQVRPTPTPKLACSRFGPGRRARPRGRRARRASTSASSAGPSPTRRARSCARRRTPTCTRSSARSTSTARATSTRSVGRSRIVIHSSVCSNRVTACGVDDHGPNLLSTDGPSLPSFPSLPPGAAGFGHQPTTQTCYCSCAPPGACLVVRRRVSSLLLFSARARVGGLTARLPVPHAGGAPRGVRQDGQGRQRPHLAAGVRRVVELVEGPRLARAPRADNEERQVTLHVTEGRFARALRETFPSTPGGLGGCFLCTWAALGVPVARAGFMARW